MIAIDSTLVLENREDRRLVTALTRCAADPDHGIPNLRSVGFDGRRAYATDAYVVGILPAYLDIVEVRCVPARRLRDALGIARGSEPVRMRFETDALHVVIGDDPLPLGDDYLPPEVVLPYDDPDRFPFDRIRENLAGSPDIEPDDRVLTSLGINAQNLARLGALVRDASDSIGHLVTVHPRGEHRPIDVRDANTGAPVGVMARIRSFDEFVARPEETDDPEEGDDA